LLCTLAACAMMALVFWINNGDTAFGQIPVVNLNAFSFLILVVYFISFRFLSNDDSENDEEDTSPLTVRQIVIRFILMAIGLVGMSIVVTALTDKLQTELRLDESLAGALFLGVATSLPELTSSIALIRRRNFNAMVGNVVGSNMFNFTIFSIVDIFSGHVIYPAASTVSLQTKNMLVFGVLSTVLTMAAILLQSKMKSAPKQSGGLTVTYAGIGALILGSYLVALVLPFSLIG